MLKFLMINIIIILCSNIVSAQECGPMCPVCSGSSDGSLLDSHSFLFSTINIPGGEEEQGVFNVRYGVFPRFDVGAGYSVKSEKVIWNARFEAFREDEDSWKPGLILGSGSVRTGSSDQSLYLHITKSWEFSEDFAVRMTTGAATLVPEYDKVYGLAGVTTSIYEKFSPFVSYDGKNFHEGIAWIPLNWLTVSVLMIESKEPALSAGFRWSYSNTSNME